jgi:DNA-binding MarR family transcriptional regulator
VFDCESSRWDQPLRDVGLVALQAAVLTRRIFLPAAGRADLSPEQWQMLLALALNDTAPDAEPETSVETIARQLSLDRDHAGELLFRLMADELVLAFEDEEDHPVRFRLSERGWELARAYTERASRFLPGWPPERFSRGPDR